MDMGDMHDGFSWGHMGASFSQYWKKNRADSALLRILTYLLAFIALLFQCLVILGCVPGAQGASSGVSSLYLLEFNSMSANNTPVRLRIGYIAMCGEIGNGPEHCAVTVGKDDSRSLRLLSTGYDDADSFDKLPDEQKISTIVFDIAEQLQNNVFVVMPAIPGFILAVAFILFLVYGTMNRPWVGPASSWRQLKRNRKLDIIRLVFIILMSVSIAFSFAVAVANSQMFAATEYITSQNDEDSSFSPGFRLRRGVGALALHWLVVLATIGYLISAILTNVEVGSVKIALTPEATAGSSGGQFFAAPSGRIEKRSLLDDPEPMAMSSPGLMPEVPPINSHCVPRAHGIVRGGAMSMRGVARRGVPGMRGVGMGVRRRGVPMRGRVI